MEPDNWKAIDNIGAGVKEIRLFESTGTYRVIYVAKFKDAVYVLHCFKKKTQATAKKDKEITATRYREIIKFNRGDDDD